MKPLPPIPGDGWRLIDPTIDSPQEGDEYLNGTNNQWELRYDDQAVFRSWGSYRRRTTAAEPLATHIIGQKVQPKFGPTPFFTTWTTVAVQPSGFAGVTDRTGIVLAIRNDCSGRVHLDAADNWVTA